MTALQLTPPAETRGHGPYGRAEVVNGRRVLRLTAEGQRVAAEWLAGKADPASWFAARYPSVMAFARSARLTHDEIDAACRRGVCLAVIKWNPARCPLDPVAAQWMRAAVQKDAERYSLCMRQTGRGEVFAGTYGPSDGPNLLDQLPDAVAEDDDPQDRKGRVLAALKRLPTREREMFGLLHGLADGEPKSVRAVAEVYGVSYQRVQQITSRVAQRLAEACGGEA